MLDLWTRARVDLGLSDGEFRGLTLRLLFALMERKEEVEHREDLRSGLLASLLYNPNRKKGAKPMHPSDFFRPVNKRRPKNRSRPQSTEKVGTPKEGAPQR